jgi:hypothetical protein
MGVVGDRRPPSGVLGISPVLFEAEAAVAANENIDAAIRLGVLDACQDLPPAAYDEA